MKEKMEPLFNVPPKKGLIIILAFSIVFACCYCCLPKPCVLHLGLFAGSSWNVPDPSVYDIVDEAIERFEKENPHITVEYESGIRLEDYSEWLSQGILNGDLPDVFFILDSELSALASIDALENLDRFAWGTNCIDASSYYPAVLDSSRWNKSLYAMPYQANPQFMFVNKTLLENEGIDLPKQSWTIDDLMDICTQVTKDLDGDGLPDQFGIYNYTWKHALEAYGVSAFSTDGTKADLLNHQVQQAINFAFDLNDLSQGVQIRQKDFDAGKTAFSPMTYAEYRTYKPYPWKIKRFSKFEWEIIPMPSAEDHQQVSQVDTLLVAMSSASLHKNEAWKLMKMLSSDPQTQRNLFCLSSALPATVFDWNHASDDVSSIDEDLDLETVELVMQNAVNTMQFPLKQEYESWLDIRLRSDLPLTEDKDLFFMNLQKEMNHMIASGYPGLIFE